MSRKFFRKYKYRPWQGMIGIGPLIMQRAQSTRGDGAYWTSYSVTWDSYWNAINVFSHPERFHFELNGKMRHGDDE